MTRVGREGVGWLAVVALATVATLAALLGAPSAEGVPIQRSAAPTPDRVLLLGDSLMFDAAPALVDVFEGDGAEIVVDQSVLGLGLTRPDYADWRMLWTDAVARHRPDTVVVFVAPFDLADLELTTKTHEQWQTEYRSSVGDAVRLLGDGVRVVWILSPDYGDQSLSRGVGVLNAAIREAQADTPFDVLDPGSLDPTAAGMRKNDGIHFCPAGAAELAARLATLLELSVSAPSVTGEWRNDARYDASILGSFCPELV